MQLRPKIEADPSITPNLCNHRVLRGAEIVSPEFGPKIAFEDLVTRQPVRAWKGWGGDQGVEVPQIVEVARGGDRCQLPLRRPSVGRLNVDLLRLLGEIEVREFDGRLHGDRGGRLTCAKHNLHGHEIRIVNGSRDVGQDLIAPNLVDRTDKLARVLAHLGAGASREHRGGCQGDCDY